MEEKVIKIEKRRREEDKRKGIRNGGKIKNKLNEELKIKERKKIRWFIKNRLGEWKIGRKIKKKEIKR